MSKGNEFIGHKNNIENMVNAIDAGKFVHAHVFAGEDGIGKSLIAKLIGLRILGERRDIEYVDLIHWTIGKSKKSIGVNEIRNLIEEVNKKPYEGKNKVIIIHEADKMTVQAQNAFLKTIEEPPKGVYIILLCENLESILETIKSRCQIHKLRALTLEEMRDFLDKEYGDLSEDKKNMLLAFSNGIPGRAEKLLKDHKFSNIRNIIIDILSSINKSEHGDMLKYEGFFIENKDSLEEIFSCLLSYIRDIIIYKETGDIPLIMNIDKIDNIKEFSSMFSFNKLEKILNSVRATKDDIDKNLNALLVFKRMLLKFQEV